MHRSGTSALTRVINLFGARLPRHVLGSNPTNVTGHWEPKAVMQVNDALLAELGSRWDDWRRVDLSQLPYDRQAHYRDAITRTIATEFEEHGVFVLKEPRICRLTGLVLQALADLDVQPMALLAVRNPIEVAESLEKRDGLSRTHAGLLWLRHVLDMEHGSRGLPRAVVPYDRLLTDWQPLLRTAFCQIGYQPENSFADAAPLIERFLSTEHRHHSRTVEEVRLDPFMGGWIADAYEALLVLERNHGSETALARLDRVRLDLNRASPVLSQLEAELVSSHESKLADAEALAAERQNSIDRISAAAADAEVVARNAVNEVKAQLADRDAEIGRLSAEAADRDAEIGRLSAEAADRDAEIGRLSALAVDRDAEIGRLSALAAYRDAELGRLSALAADRAAEIGRLSAEAADREAEIGRLSAEAADRATEIGRLSSEAADREAELGRLRSEAADREVSFQSLTVDLSAKAAKIEAMDAQLGAHQAVLASKERESAESRQVNADQAKQIAITGSRLTQMSSLADVLRGEIATLKETLSTTNTRLAWAEQRWRDLERSTSWRVTRPLRELKLNVAGPHSIYGLYRKRLGDLSRRAKIRAHARIVRKSPLFDAVWYAERYPDVYAARVDPAIHYVAHGASEGRDPGPRFSTLQYLSLNPDVSAAGLNPLVHYISHGLAEGRAIASHGGVNTVPAAHTQSGWMGYYGCRELNAAELFGYVPSPGSGGNASAEEYACQTQEIIRKYGLSTVPLTDSILLRYGPVQQIRALFTEVETATHVFASSATPTYSIVTPFFSHADYFRSCARSVAEVLAVDEARIGQSRIEWIVINDDPMIADDVLKSHIPEALRKFTTIKSDGMNKGIASRLNEGIAAARKEWILLLDCDDALEGHALSVLDHYILKFPRCRFVSSAMIDIDEEGRELRRRKRDAHPERMFEQGMTAGHLMAIRRDLFKDVGSFDSTFDGCQDFEFVLRVASTEPILRIPDHLYAYRWHSRSQSVSAEQRQAQIAERVRAAFVERYIHTKEGRTAEQPVRSQLVARGACIMRTQGTRIDLLAEAVRSVAVQDPPVDPIVCVHGDNEAVRAVEAGLREQQLDFICLQASDMSKRRGHPANVGLRHVYASPEKYGFVCFLDDDDIYYPFFSSRMHEAMSSSGADVVYCMTNKRIPGRPAESAQQLLPEMCLLSDANFIPINSFIIRSSLINDMQLQFDESLEYSEDWSILLLLLEACAGFHPLFETLAEYRIIGDGNVVTKKSPRLYEEACARMRLRAEAIGRSRGPFSYWRSLVNFPFHHRVPLMAHEHEMMAAAASRALTGSSAD